MCRMGCMPILTVNVTFVILSVMESLSEDGSKRSVHNE